MARADDRTSLCERVSATRGCGGEDEEDPPSSYCSTRVRRSWPAVWMLVRRPGRRRLLPVPRRDCSHEGDTAEATGVEVPEATVGVASGIQGDLGGVLRHTVPGTNGGRAEAPLR